MTEPTVEEVREALDNIERNYANRAGAAALDVMVLMKVTRLWVNAAEPAPSDPILGSKPPSNDLPENTNGLR